MVKKYSKNILPSYFYPQQKEALGKLSKFLNSNDLEFTLSGYAGTGKTFLLNYFVNKICNVSVCPTAPTHRAVREVEKSLNKKGRTLQSLLGLRPNLDLNNFDISNPSFKVKGNVYIKNYKLVIIDEASMINDNLYNFLLDNAKKYNVKLLYVGDPLQLPPIQKGATSKHGSKAFKVKNGYNLTEIVRQEKGNPLLELFPLIRSDVINNTRTFLNYIINNRYNIKNDIGYEVVNEFKFKEYIQNEYNELIKNKQIDKFRILSFTNDSVESHNQFVRNNVIHNNSEILTKDDVLTSYTTIVDEFLSPIITNSDDYIIENIREYVNHYDIKTYAVNLVNNNTKISTKTIQIVDHSDESLLTYYKHLNKLHKDALNAHHTERVKKWVQYYSFKDELLTMISFPLGKSTLKKDIDYGYAITIHKSQGTTFDVVFVDLTNILYYVKYGKLIPRKLDIIARLIYVAISRARNKVIIKL